MATQQPPQLNSIPAGFDWKRDAATKARDAGKFLYVGGKDITKRALSGSPRYWNSTDPAEQSIIYNTTYRITGTPANVAQALRFRNFTEAEIQAALADAITKDNFATTKLQAWTDELNWAKAAAAKKPVKENPYTLKDYVWFAQHLSDAKILTKATGAANAPAAAAAGKRRRQNLADRVKGLAAGKVLDVSAIDYATGDGAVSRIPTVKPRTGKYGTQRIPFISNNVQNYQRAIELVYGAQGLQTYAADIATVAKAINPNGQVPVAAPVALPPAVTVPGAVLAPPVTINGFPVVQ
jgi:hypothetical protein